VQYSEERKEAVLAKMMPLHNCNGAELATEESISTATLYNWPHDAREQGRLLPQGSNEPEGWKRVRQV
jgi:transposase-like protein